MLRGGAPPLLAWTLLPLPALDCPTVGVFRVDGTDGRMGGKGAARRRCVENFPYLTALVPLRVVRLPAAALRPAGSGIAARCSSRRCLRFLFCRVVPRAFLHLAPDILDLLRSFRGHGRRVSGFALPSACAADALVACSPLPAGGSARWALGLIKKTRRLLVAAGSPLPTRVLTYAARAAARRPGSSRALHLHPTFAAPVLPTGFCTPSLPYAH